MARKSSWKLSMLVAGICLIGTPLQAATNLCTVPSPVPQDDVFTVGLVSPVRVDPLANDSHPEGIPLFVTGFAGNPCLEKPEGNLCLNADGTFTFTRAAGVEEDVFFTYSVTDGLGTVGPVAVTLRVFDDLGGPVNVAPVATDDSVVIAEGAAQLVIPVAALLGNDLDPDGDPLSVFPADVGSPSKGSLLVTGTDAAGAVTELTFVSTPIFETAGSDQFTYLVRDPEGLGSVGTVSVFLGDGVLNRPPVANDDPSPTGAYTMTQGGIRTWHWQEVLENDTDPDVGDTLSVSTHSVPLGCCWTFDQQGFTYQAPSSLTGTVSFLYKVTDGRAESDWATVRVNVEPPDIEPYQAVDDSFNVDQYGRLEIYWEAFRSPINLLGNDIAPSVLQVVPFAFSEPLHGRLEPTLDGHAVVYIPDDGYVGPDSFSYTFQERFSPQNSDSATVHLQVVPVTPDPPPLTATDDSYLIRPGGSYIVHWDELLANDLGSQLFFLGSDIAALTTTRGQVEWVTPGYDLVNGGDTLPEGYKGALRYVNTTGVAGDFDFYQYRVFSAATSELVWSSVFFDLVDPASWDFLAMPDELSTFEGKDLSILYSTLKSNDNLSGGVPLLGVGELSRPRFGSFSHLVNPAGVVYTPPKDFVGVDYFSYRVVDDDFQRADTVGRVYILVYPGKPTPQDDGPVLVYQDESFDIDVLVNDTDPNEAEGDRLKIFEVEPPLHGVAARVDSAAGERIRYTAPAGFTGSDSFVYTVRDDYGLTAQATVQVSVQANAAPLAVPRLFCDGLHCRLDGSSSTDDLGLVSWEWEVTGPLGVQSASGISAIVDLGAVGEHTVALTVTDVRGKEGRSVLQVTVDGSPGNPPIARFASSCVTVVCTFDGSLSRDDVEVTGYAWDFGDGSPTQTGVTAIHTYPSTGTYLVTLTASDASGSDGAEVQTVTLVDNSAPIARKDATIARPGQGKTIRVLRNDEDPEGLALSLAAVSTPASGTASVQPDGTILYVSTAGFRGTDRFTYQVTDGEETATGDVRVWVLTEIEELILLRLSP